ncbi:hypothetical protein ACIGB6_14380 [Paeniglutamicibacter gangotriensis]|uniref:hypothetical protein n=1 Tax=Paeniglutamicibacter gangotriensis TaxID=254787 RepID=UPI0037CA5C97
MGLFSRKKVAKRLDVTPARVSQMAASGAMIAPIEDEDGTDRGWPATYVEEFAARRAGRQTSRSIYGFPPQTTNPIRVADTVVTKSGSKDQALIQLLQVDAGVIGLITPLWKTVQQEAPYKATLGYRPFRSFGFEDDSLAYILEAEAALEIDLYDIAWVHVESDEAHEIVVVFDEDRRQTTQGAWGSGAPKQTHSAKQEKVSWETLRTKLGSKVPLLDIPTLEAVEAWDKAGKTVTTVELDTNRYFNIAMSAALLVGLESRERSKLHAGTAKAEALRLAIARFTRIIDWEASGAQAWTSIAQLEPQNIELLVKTCNPVYDQLRGTIQTCEMEQIDLTAEQRQSAADELAHILYEEFGEFGATPDAAIAYALEGGIRIICDLLPGEMNAENIQHQAVFPVFHELRSFILERCNEHEEYYRGLKPVSKADAPPARWLLSSLTPAEYLDYGSRHDNIQLLNDKDGNYVLSQLKTSYNQETYTLLTVAVPIAKHQTDQKKTALKEFEEILVVPDTQEGPVFLRVGGDLHVMPFGQAHSGSFTHGYSGGGPGNLRLALISFLQWIAGANMTDTGKERVRSIVFGADQDSYLRINRAQVLRPGMFEIATSE